MLHSPFPHSSAVVLFSSSTKRAAKKKKRKLWKLRTNFPICFRRRLHCLYQKFPSSPQQPAAALKWKQIFLVFTHARNWIAQFFFIIWIGNFRIAMRKIKVEIRDEIFNTLWKISCSREKSRKIKKLSKKKNRKFNKKKKEDNFEDRNKNWTEPEHVKNTTDTLLNELHQLFLSEHSTNKNNTPQAAAAENTTSTPRRRLTTDSYYQRIVSLTTFFYACCRSPFSLTIACMTWCCLLSSLVAPRPRWMEWN